MITLRAIENVANIEDDSLNSFSKSTPDRKLRGGRGANILKRLIVTGDDFGLSVSVNRGIEEAHRRGILTSASLMVRAGATADAAARAHRFPSLRVGLHVVLVDGTPVLPPQTIPDLVGRDGGFSSHLVMAGLNFFFRPGVRRQLKEEIRAQFEAFQNTGLSLDHVNAHHHMHLHPAIHRLVLKVGGEYGLRAARLPYEPVLLSWRASKERLFQRLLTGLFLFPWAKLLESKLKRENIHSNSFIFGMNDRGHMTQSLVLSILRSLPQGVGEMYFHPAIPGETDCPVRDERCQEFEVLTTPEVIESIKDLEIKLTTFSDL